MRVLFLTHRLPYAPNRGDRIRAYYLLREMARFASVSLFSLVHDGAEELELTRTPFADEVVGARVHRLGNVVRGVAALPSARPLTHVLLNAAGATAALDRLVAARRPDVVVAFCSGMARFALEPPLTALPFVLDMVDVDSVKWRQLANRSSGPRRWIYSREARTLSAFEAQAVERARATLVVNERERDELERLTPSARIDVVENGIDVDAFVPAGPPAAAPTVVFCGMMGYGPNDEGVRWFAHEVWPRIRSARSDARFLIVGAEPTRAVSALAEGDSSITVTGAVPAVQPYLWQSAVSVAPLLLARGLQNKVLEALAAGLPVVATPAVAAGLPAAAHPGCRVAEDPDRFATELLQLLALDPAERRRLAGNVRLDRLSWSARLKPIEAILRRAASR